MSFIPSLSEHREIVYACNGNGFKLSDEAIDLLCQQYPDIFPIIDSSAKSGTIRDKQGVLRLIDQSKINRSDRRLIEVIDKIGLYKASAPGHLLAIKLIPSGVDYKICLVGNIEVVCDIGNLKVIYD
ncbi:hypothetical protein BH23THE1_BH23THE1_29160 [soil metagenome]